jgi:hypothetical protein
VLLVLCGVIIYDCIVAGYMACELSLVLVSL